MFDYLVIPVGAKLISRSGSDTFIIEEHTPKSLDNLKNLSSVAEINLHLDGIHPRFIRLSGPDGQLCIMNMYIHITPSQALESLARFDTSKTKLLRIDSNSDPLSRDPPYRAPLPMKNLRTLVLSRSTGLLCAFMDVLNPNTSPSKEVVCPLLQELTFVRRPQRGLGGRGEEKFDIQTMIEIAAARASTGAKLDPMTCWSSKNTSCTWNTVLGLVYTRMVAIVATGQTEERRILVVVLWRVDLRL